MTFSASHDNERDAWMEFFEMVGGSRTRMDTLIEEEVGKIKSEVGSRESILDGFSDAENVRTRTKICVMHDYSPQQGLI